MVVARRDSANVGLCRRHMRHLERKKIRCWIAPRDVKPGVQYGESLMEAINTSRLLVLVFSKNSNNSGHVMREVERAASKGLNIIPLLLDYDCSQSGHSAESPE